MASHELSIECQRRDTHAHVVSESFREFTFLSFSYSLTRVDPSYGFISICFFLAIEVVISIEMEPKVRHMENRIEANERDVENVE